ncbi:NAD-binding protein [Mesorhizobium amorphae]|uniref:NAD-binding protein n=1 Tax=Mesorhizobium amorphae TaxID=71433 RepID=UPI0031F510B8
MSGRQAFSFSWVLKRNHGAARMLDILSGTSASSLMLKDRGPRMIMDDPEASSTVDIFVKDLGIVLEAGQETRAALPFAVLAHQLFLSRWGGPPFDRLEDCGRNGRSNPMPRSPPLTSTYSAFPDNV